MGISEALQTAFLKLHQRVYEASGGRVGHRMIGVPTLLLRTTGRRSSQPRTNALVYARDGDRYVVVASNGGQDRPPGWLFNVRAEPAVSIQVATEAIDATAGVVEAADPDYDRLWRLVNANNHNRYDAYQRKTERRIPLVIVTPA
ncbi:MAG: nitroreductase family deazaflavin-dependent oxidoreductase [Acidimicrobiales bacterium]